MIPFWCNRYHIIKKGGESRIGNTKLHAENAGATIPGI